MTTKELKTALKQMEQEGRSDKLILRGVIFSAFKSVLRGVQKIF